MKRYFFILLLLSTGIIKAQENDCIDRQLKKLGNWTKLKETVKSAPADLAIQRRFFNALHNPLQAAYQPKGLDAAYSGSFQPVKYGQPVAYYWYTLFGERYFCEGDALVLNRFDINTLFTTEFNYVSFLEIYDTTGADHSVGYWSLREGIPKEIRPGIWQFDDTKTSLGGGNQGLTKLWLITYDGQLPWSFVTRREFLLKRKRFLKREMSKEEPRLKEQLASWDLQKKIKEQELKSDPTKLSAYLSGTHNPAIERVQANFKKLIGEYDNALARLDEQLAAPEEELNKWAIVIKSTKNNFDYSFTDKMEPFAELLTKPNATYFKKHNSPAVPQMITVSIKYDPKNPVSSLFAQEIEKNISLDYLKSFIGKTIPPAFTQSLPVQNRVNTMTNELGSSTFSKQESSAIHTKSTTTSKPLTPQGPLAKDASFLTGTLSAPTGVPITLANGNAEITITASKSKGNLYNTTPIRFSQPLKKDQTFNVTIKKMPDNMKAVVYKGNGIVPDGSDKIKIGIDYTYELITRSSDDQVFSSFYESTAPVIGGMGSEEGRYVAFVSWTKGFAGNNGSYRQIFWRDRNTGETKLISTTSNGLPANADCNLPSMSADGQIVVFESKASNLVMGDNNNKKDIFLWNAKTNTVEMVSRTYEGGFSDGESYDASISGNGQFVVFTSDAPSMSNTQKGRSLYNIFLRNLTAGTTEMLSIDPTTKTGGNGVKASISFMGDRVAFCSPSNTLVANDNNNFWDIFLWEKDKQGLRRISFTHDGKERNQGDESGSRQVAAALSGDGRYIAYATTATNMVPGDYAKYQDVFVYDIDGKKLQVASFTDDGQPGNHDSPIEQGERVAINYDGTWIAFPTKATNLGVQSSNILLFNTKTGKKTSVTDTRGSYVSRPSISYSGSYVVFGKSEALDKRSGVAFGNSGIFAFFTGNGLCRDCK